MREANAITLGSVPKLVDGEHLVEAIDSTLVGHIDGSRTVGEIARRAQLPLAHVRALLFELAWARAIVIDEEPEPEAMPLVRERRSPLVRGLVALWARLTRQPTLSIVDSRPTTASSETAADAR